jgi:hypothetical protein
MTTLLLRLKIRIMAEEMGLKNVISGVWFSQRGSWISWKEVHMEGTHEVKLTQQVIRMACRYWSLFA